MNKHGKLFIISGPSAVGKTSLVNSVLPFFDSHVLSRVITYTSKSPRLGEVPGADYHFISEAEFKERIAQDFFLEWSTAYGNYYGCARSLLDELKGGKSYLLIIDRAGAQQILSVTQAVTVCIMPPNLPVLEERLRLRSSESNQDFERRIKLASHELELEQNNRLYTYHVQNTFFDVALQNLIQIITSELSINNVPGNQQKRSISARI